MCPSTFVTLKPSHRHEEVANISHPEWTFVTQLLLTSGVCGNGQMSPPRFVQIQCVQQR